MGLTLTRQYNFSELIKNVGTLLSSIESAGTNAGNVASNCSSELSGLQFGSWSDDVSNNLKNYCLSVKAGMDEVVNDISGGSFSYLKTAINGLLSSLQKCNECQTRFNNQSNRLRFVNDDKLKEKIIRSMEAEGRNLDRYIDDCNQIINNIEAIQFNGTVTYTPGGGPFDLEDTQALYDESFKTESTPESTAPKEFYTADGQRYHMEGTEKGLNNVLVLTDTDTGYIYDGWTSGAVGRDIYFLEDPNTGQTNEGYAIVDGKPMHIRRGADSYFYFDNGVPVSGNPNASQGTSEANGGSFTGGGASHGF